MGPPPRGRSRSTTALVTKLCASPTATMHLMYYLTAKGERIYTLKVRRPPASLELVPADPVRRLTCSVLSLAMLFRRRHLMASPRNLRTPPASPPTTNSRSSA